MKDLIRQFCATTSRKSLLIVSVVSLFIGVSSFYYNKYSPSTLTLEMLSTQPGSGQVFWDIGKGYSEKLSTRFPLDVNSEMATYTANLPAAGLQSLRIDPIDSEGRFEIKSLTLQGSGGLKFELRGQKLRDDLRIMQNVSEDKPVHSGANFSGSATTRDSSLEVGDIPEYIYKRSNIQRVEIATLWTVGALLTLLCLVKLAQMDDCFNLQKVPDKVWMIVLALAVVLTNLQIYRVEIYPQDDNNWLYIWQSVSTLLTRKDITIGTVIDRIMTWISVVGNLYLARTIILIGILVPLSLLLYRILRKLDYPVVVSLFTAGLIAFFPGQIEIPIFINGSYVAEAMLIMAVAFWSGLKFVDLKDSGRYGWYLLAIAAFYWALKISELVVPTAAALIFCFLCWARFSKRAWMLSCSIVALTALHFYNNILHNGRDVVQRSWNPLTLEGAMKAFYRFLECSVPYIYVPQGYSIHWIGLVLFVAAASFLVASFKKVSLDRRSNLSGMLFPQTAEYTWRIVFPLIWWLSSLCVLAIAYQMPRLVLFPVFGFYLLLSFVFYEALQGTRYRNVLTTVLLVSLLAGSAVGHYVNIEECYEPMNQAHRKLISLSQQYQYPTQSQIVVTGMDTSTNGHWWWSTGYLRYALKRTDISGLVGNEFMFSNPFQPAKYQRGGMIGLELQKPLFLYRLSGGKLRQILYCLIWEDDDANSDFSIYRLHPTSGELTPLVKGRGMDEFRAATDRLGKERVSRASIMWGGVPSPSDEKRLGL